ncbi:hypothetical protein BDR26DRAFT_998122 [Obelidium mucronatum]|nr:hypothetical protein BDR26DRAFT_998122 [Obelidium mucronatum]
MSGAFGTICTPTTTRNVGVQTEFNVTVLGDRYLILDLDSVPGHPGLSLYINNKVPEQDTALVGEKTVVNQVDKLDQRIDGNCVGDDEAAMAENTVYKRTKSSVHVAPASLPQTHNVEPGVEVLAKSASRVGCTGDDKMDGEDAGDFLSFMASKSRSVAAFRNWETTENLHSTTPLFSSFTFGTSGKANVHPKTGGLEKQSVTHEVFAAVADTARPSKRIRVKNPLPPFFPDKPLPSLGIGSDPSLEVVPCAHYKEHNWVPTSSNDADLSVVAQALPSSEGWTEDMFFKTKFDSFYHFIGCHGEFAMLEFDILLLEALNQPVPNGSRCYSMMGVVGLECWKKLLQRICDKTVVKKLTDQITSNYSHFDLDSRLLVLQEHCLKQALEYYNRDDTRTLMNARKISLLECGKNLPVFNRLYSNAVLKALSDKRVRIGYLDHSDLCSLLHVNDPLVHAHGDISGEVIDGVASLLETRCPLFRYVPTGFTDGYKKGDGSFFKREAVRLSMSLLPKDNKGIAIPCSFFTPVQTLTLTRRSYGGHWFSVYYHRINHAIYYVNSAPTAHCKSIVSMSATEECGLCSQFFAVKDMFMDEESGVSVCQPCHDKLLIEEDWEYCLLCGKQWPPSQMARNEADPSEFCCAQCNSEEVEKATCGICGDEHLKAELLKDTESSLLCCEGCNGTEYICCFCGNSVSSPAPMESTVICDPCKKSPQCYGCGEVFPLDELFEVLVQEVAEDIPDGDPFQTADDPFEDTIRFVCNACKIECQSLDNDAVSTATSPSYI